MSWCLWRAVYSLDKRLFFSVAGTEARSRPCSHILTATSVSILSAGGREGRSIQFLQQRARGTVVPLLEVVAGRPRRLAVQ